MSLTAETLNELCAPSYLDRLADAPVDELRQMREQSQQAELALSYLRRVVQAEIDLVLAEMGQRQKAGRSDIGRLVEELPSILSSPPPVGSEPAHTPVPATTSELGDSLELEELLSAVLLEAGGSSAEPGGLLPGANLCTFSDSELQESLERLREVESGVSAKRRLLHGHIDEIQSAIVDRYKTGAADPDSLLA